MRLIESTHADGQEKRELPPPFRNPFVHDLRFTTAQKLQVRVAFVFADVDAAVGREMLPRRCACDLSCSPTIYLSCYYYISCIWLVVSSVRSVV
uniref:Uncharacterized protein n=1 Tax=Sinocyclocheilus anshuiensis TaxID=1608454 RepID=A0A671SFR0_9TELE